MRDLYKIVMEPEELENIGVRNRRHSNESINCPAAMQYAAAFPQGQRHR